jgi:hypothetical protein
MVANQCSWDEIATTLNQSVVYCKFHWCWLYFQEFVTKPMDDQNEQKSEQRTYGPFNWTDELVRTIVIVSYICLIIVICFQDDALIDALMLHGRRKFREAAQTIGRGVTAIQCQAHVRLRNAENMGNWTIEEVIIFKHIIFLC